MLQMKLVFLLIKSEIYFMGGHQESTEHGDEWVLNLSNLLYQREADKFIVFACLDLRRETGN